VKLVFIHGPPGVGKLTVGQELQQIMRYKLFHNHLTIDMLTPVFDWDRAFVDLREEIWMMVLRRAAQENLRGVIFTFVFEPTISPDFFTRVQEMIVACGGSILPVELRCDIEELERRVVSESRSAFGKMRSADRLRRWVENGDYRPTVPLPGNLIIDTTSITAGDTARKIATYIWKQGLGITY
jgi:hypothetical protein